MENSLTNQISKYYKSFSGTDTLAFIMMPGSAPVVIGSLTTISYSMYRNKKPVINIGRTNINGVTRGSRIFAGTMIFTLINQHWLKELQEQLDWLKGFKELKVDELPLFDIMIVSANEYGNAVVMYIYGIDFTDEAQTISVEDLFTENVFSFVARDISNFKAFNTRISATYKEKSEDKRNEYSQKYYVIDGSDITLEDLAALEQELSKSKLEQSNSPKLYTLNRDLYYSSSGLILGNDVAKIQELLNKTNLFELDVNGIFDINTDEAVRKYQSMIGDEIDGVVDNKLYNHLINQTSNSDKKTGIAVNKHGVFVYEFPDFNSNIVDTIPYKDYTLIHDYIKIDSQYWYKVDTGYVPVEDLYSSLHASSEIEFPTLEYLSSGVYVTMAQSALSIIYPYYTDITGTYNKKTVEQVKRLQKDNGLEETGNVDYVTWLLLQSLSGSLSDKTSDDGYNITLGIPQGTYNISEKEISNQLSLMDISISCNNDINVKVSAICIYDDDNSETITKTFTIKEEETIDLTKFKNAFVYNTKYGKTPKQVDFVVYPYNKQSYKWSIICS